MRGAGYTMQVAGCGRGGLWSTSKVISNLENFNIKNMVVYNLPLPPNQKEEMAQARRSA
jgi:hypothetical protein